MVKKILIILTLITTTLLSACDSSSPINNSIIKYELVSSIVLRSDGISQNEMTCTNEQVKEILRYLPQLDLYKVSANDVPVFYGGGLEIQLNYSDNTNFIFTVVGENYYEFNYNGTDVFYQDLSDTSASLAHTIYTAYYNVHSQKH